MTEYTAMREELESALQLASDIAFSGLESLSRFNSAILAHADRFRAIGLLYGSDLFGQISSEGMKGQSDIHWNGEAASEAFSTLCAYLRLSLKRLDFLEASSWGQK